MLPSSTYLIIITFISISKGPIKVKVLIDIEAIGYVYIN